MAERPFLVAGHDDDRVGDAVGQARQRTDRQVVAEAQVGSIESVGNGFSI